MQIQKNRFSCFIIGEGTLPIQCGEILQAHGHELCGIISADASVKRWADRRDIPHIEPIADIAEFLSQRSFDYLFSIVNQHILTQEVLELPRKCAINYHDAPLPRYAGTHATSWALLNQEVTHGISWHLMSDLVDAGDILKQVRFDISNRETAFTLNGKCYEAAIDSFTRLSDELSSGRVSVSKQNLDERTYFPLYKRPPAGCVFSWNSCAYDIDALVRALNFGPYPNPLGTPKFAIGSYFVVVPEIEVLSSTTETPTGTITGIEPNTLKVSTASYEIALHKVLTIDGEPLPIPDLVMRYGLYEGYRFEDVEPELAERITVYDAKLCKQEAFWVERLEKFQPVTLPYAARTGAHQQPTQYMSVQIPVPSEVKTFLKEHHAVWKTGDFLFAAFAAYLARLGGEASFDIGYREVERQRELLGLEGLFAFYVPLRIDVGSGQSFKEVFHALQEQTELTRQHKTYARDVKTRYPVFHSVPKPYREHKFSVLVERVERLDNYEAMPGSELTLVIPENSTECCWVYDAKVLDEESIGRMLHQFATFVQGIAADPDRPIAYLPLLSEEERHQLLVRWNPEQPDYPKNVCLHQLVEMQVERSPDAVAIIFENEQLTYKELNHRANQLAHYLQALGVGPEVPVALCMELGLDVAVGILGILKAGGALVPMEPTYPQERLAFILQDTQAPVLLTQKRQLKELPQHAGHVVCIDTSWQAIAQESTDNLVSGVKPENLAYILYTSGSTGKPKGVMLSHFVCCTRELWEQRTYPMTEEDHILLKSAWSSKEFFWPLLAGAKAVMTRPGGYQDSAYLVKLIAEQKITVISVVPSVLKLLLEEPTIGTCTSLRHIFCVGEAMPVEVQEKFFEQHLPGNLYNLYGLNEANYAAVWQCQCHDDRRFVPIGRPTDLQIYLLDRYLQPIPIGVTGELYISGVGLASGYFNRPELTAERFLPNPFSDKPDAKLYKTGDLARFLPDGNIEYLGRGDYQVSIRGLRIELGEIETVLEQHPAVQETVVMVREYGAGDRRLIAYIIPSQKQTPTTDELRSWLKKSLPDYMMPSAFAILAELPRTFNGKINRLALPAPEQVQLEPERTFVAPRTTTEQQLADIWAHVLNLEKVSTHDNFFELGGHSLLATQAMSRLREAFRINLALHDLFEAPTVSHLAQRIEAFCWAVQNLQAPASNSAGKELQDSFTEREEISL